MARRASLKDRAPKAPPRKGRGVDALFDPPSTKDLHPTDDIPSQTTNIADTAALDVPRAATFNLFGRHQDFLDEFVKSGKSELRKKATVGVGAVNKSAVVQELLEILNGDEALQRKIVKNLERKAKAEGSRHDPRKRRS